MSVAPEQAVAAIEAGRLLAIVRRRDAAAAERAASALLGAGVRALEFSLVAPGALEAIAATAPAAPAGSVVGAGTVLSAADAEAALAAGAHFLVSPGLAPEVAALAAERGVLHLPGALTPGEVAGALAAGAPLVKLFPAGRFGPGYLRDLLGPFPAARFVATGGIDAANAAEFLAAGAAAVAVGGALDRIEEAGLPRAAASLLELTSDRPQGG